MRCLRCMTDPGSCSAGPPAPTSRASESSPRVRLSESGKDYRRVGKLKTRAEESDAINRNYMSRSQHCPTCTCYKFHSRTTFVTPDEPAVGSVSWVRSQTGQESGCVMCGGPLPSDHAWWVHGNRTTCSNACRQRLTKAARPSEESLIAAGYMYRRTKDES